MAMSRRPILGWKRTLNQICCKPPKSHSLVDLPPLRAPLSGDSFHIWPGRPIWQCQVQRLLREQLKECKRGCGKLTARRGLPTWELWTLDLVGISLNLANHAETGD